MKPALNIFHSIFILFLLMPGRLNAKQDVLKKLTLHDCLAIAVKNNFDLQLADENITIARAIYQQSYSRRYPQFGLEAGYMRFSEVMEASIAPEIQGIPFTISPMHLRFGDEDNYSAKIKMTQPLFTGFQLKNASQAAGQQIKVAEAGKKTTLNTLRFDVTKTFYNLYKAEQILRIARLSRQSVEAHLKDVENLLTQGMARQTDLLQVKIKQTEMDLLISQAEHRITVLKSRLLNLLGLDISTKFDIVADSVALCLAPESDPAPTDRPELQQLQFQKQALQHQIKAAQGSYYPTLSLIGFYEYSKPGLNKLENKWDGYWVVGLSAQWPLWDWGNRSALLQQTKAQYRKLNLSQQKLTRAVQLDIQHTRQAMKEAEQRLKIARENRFLSAENYKLIDDQYKQGVVTNTEFLDAETKLTRAKIEEWTAMADYRIAIADYERALGRWQFNTTN